MRKRNIGSFTADEFHEYMEQVPSGFQAHNTSNRLQSHSRRNWEQYVHRLAALIKESSFIEFLTLMLINESIVAEVPIQNFICHNYHTL